MAYPAHPNRARRSPAIQLLVNRGVPMFAVFLLLACGQSTSPLEPEIAADTQPPTAVVDVLDASEAVDEDARVEFGAAFSLDASRSVDVGGEIVRYTWGLPDGTTVAFDTPLLAVTDIVTTPFPVGEHTFGLIVTDDSGNASTPTQVTVTVVDTQAPTAVLDVRDAQGRLVVSGRVESGQAFSLDGSRSIDAEGRVARYEWSLPDGATITTDAPTLAVTDILTPLALGSHTFGLAVTDDSGNRSTPAQLTITLVDTQAPTAVLTVTDPAGRPLVGDVRIGSPFSLSGRRSVDLGGRIVTYQWRLPDGSTIRTDAPTLAVTDVVTTPFGTGRHTFGLTVTDDSGNESTLVQVTVTVVF